VRALPTGPDGDDTAARDAAVPFEAGTWLAPELSNGPLAPHREDRGRGISGSPDPSGGAPVSARLDARKGMKVRSREG